MACVVKNKTFNALFLIMLSPEEVHNYRDTNIQILIWSLQTKGFNFLKKDRWDRYHISYKDVKFIFDPGQGCAVDPKDRCWYLICTEKKQFAKPISIGGKTYNWRQFSGEDEYTASADPTVLDTPNLDLSNLEIAAMELELISKRIVGEY